MLSDPPPPMHFPAIPHAGVLPLTLGFRLARISLPLTRILPLLSLLSARVVEWQTRQT